MINAVIAVTQIPLKQQLSIEQETKNIPPLENILLYFHIVLHSTAFDIDCESSAAIKNILMVFFVICRQNAGVSLCASLCVCV